ncbi:MAG: methyltransferase domain-containing protein [Bryobacterales bacterium]|nr:methyltransferase domain-containing protein [Bryobacterales bacterium]
MGIRRIQAEFLDTAGDEEAGGNLEDLRHINRRLGGYAILRRLMRQWYTPADAFTMLDVGAASGDMGRALLETFPRAVVVSIDRNARNLRDAGSPKLLADAFHLPFGPASFDVVFSSLFLHHFEDDAVVELLGGMHAAARKAVVAVDLERHPLAKAFLPATRWLFGWHEITLHDGPVSVAAGFRKEELAALARRAGLRGPRVRLHPPWFRLSLVEES